jgi:branched-chain amino acid transport system permease protein
MIGRERAGVSGTEPGATAGSSEIRRTRSLPTLRWSRFEIAFWLIPIAAYFLFPRYLTLGSQVLIA